MRTAVWVGCLGLLLSGCSGMSPAEELPEDHWSRNPAAVPIMKIGRGVTNIVISPADIPATVVRASHEHVDLGIALVAGTGEGIVNAVVRLLAGVAEVLSFPLVNQPDPLYDRPLGEWAFKEKPARRPDTGHDADQIED